MAHSAPLISVVVCTYNRADYLRRALASLAAQPYPHAKFEVLVVDNGSSDHTPSVVEESATRLPVRRIFEQKLGLCHARNTGWKAAAGQYVAYFDDDAVADLGWLSAIEDAFAAGSDVGAVGGPARAIWEAPRPLWLSDVAARALTILDWGASHIIPDVRVEWLAGANMAVRRDVLAEVRGFHPRLDRVGHNMLSSGDTFLQRQVLLRGHAIRYEARIGVGHAVPASRLTKRWFRERYYWQGISDSVIHLIDKSPSGIERTRRAATLTRKLLRDPSQMRALASLPDDPDAFTRMCFAWITVGQIAGLMGAARQ
jgi:glucosyl-dolichyl phosphate glucuronosyltransferase